MNTSVNNNNIESNNQEFFTKGKKYRCIKSVTSNKNGRETFTKGQIYEQYTEPSVFYGWLRNNQGERHAWPQIDEMADYLETWPETKPEDIDPRLYFEPVEIVTEAEALQPASVISDPDGREFRDFKTWNGMTVKAEERQKWTRFFAEGIINKVNFGGNGSTYKHSEHLAGSPRNGRLPSAGRRGGIYVHRRNPEPLRASPGRVTPFIYIIACEMNHYSKFFRIFADEKEIRQREITS